MIAAYLRIPSSRLQCSLHHGARVAYVERERGVRAASRILRTEIRAFAVVVESTGVLGIDQPRVLVLHEFLHHREHVNLAFINEHFGVTLVSPLYLHVTEMHMVDAIAGREPAAHLDRVAPHLPRYSAIEGDAVGGAVHDTDQFLPAFDRSHDLLGPTADWRRGIVRVQGETYAGLLGLRNHGL